MGCKGEEGLVLQGSLWGPEGLLGGGGVNVGKGGWKGEKRVNIEPD